MEPPHMAKMEELFGARPAMTRLPGIGLDINDAVEVVQSDSVDSGGTHRFAISLYLHLHLRIHNVIKLDILARHIIDNVSFSDILYSAVLLKSEKVNQTQKFTNSLNIFESK